MLSTHSKHSSPIWAYTKPPQHGLWSRARSTGSAAPLKLVLLVQKESTAVKDEKEESKEKAPASPAPSSPPPAALPAESRDKPEKEKPASEGGFFSLFGLGVEKNHPSAIRK
jgi:hypothetical protein